ncbi:AAA family ATPase [Alteromonas gracilis]
MRSVSGGPSLGDVASGVPQLDRPVLVGIDGVDGSGKTTYAAALSEALERPSLVVHLDDFHHPAAIRHRLGRDSPEGFLRDTCDLAAFERCVLSPLSRGDRRIVPAAFDHRSDRPVEHAPVTVTDETVVIVEGLFVHRDELHLRWDVSVLLDVPFAVSVARLAARDGSHPDPDHPSMRRYVEGQRLYFERCRPRERATWVVPNG